MRKMKKTTKMFLLGFAIEARGGEIFNSYDKPVDLGIAKKK